MGVRRVEELGRAGGVELKKRVLKEEERRGRGDEGIESGHGRD